MGRFIVLSTAALLASGAALCQPLRLDGLAKPLHYSADLTVIPDRDTVEGTMTVDVDLSRITRSIALNAHKLAIKSAHIQSGTMRQQAETSSNGDVLTLNVTENLPPGRARIEIAYTAPVTGKDTQGIFRREENGAWYTFTQFEPIEARDAFPCFDEPALKAPWQVTLRVPKDAKAFSNTPVESEDSSGDLKVVHFKQTPPLPTYLIAFAVGPFDVVDAGTAGVKHTPVRIIVPKGRAERAAFSRMAAPKIVAAIEKYFGVPYPFEKLDMVALPTNLFGAMENAGLITYADSLLVAAATGEEIERQRQSASVIAHETAHQWFGDLVTMRWWDDLWLNEAFATWMAPKALAGVFPEWKPEQEYVDVKQTALKADSLNTARKIRQPIAHHGDFDQAFDGITYQKGASVIRMFESYVGPEAFRTGLQRYFKTHEWGNATAAEFLAAIGEAAGTDIAPAFSTFLDKAGVPLLHVKLNCETGKPPAVQLEQERLLPVGTTGSRQSEWDFPVCVRYGNGGDPHRECVVLKSRSESVKLKEAQSCPAWVFGDAGAAGYYGVKYEGQLGSVLGSAVEKLSPMEQLDALKNAQHLGMNGLAPLADALSLAKELANSPDREVAIAAASTIATPAERLTPELRAPYAAFVRGALGDRVRKLGLTSKPTDTEDDKLIRPAVVGALGLYGQDEELIQKMKQMAEAWTADQKSIDPDMADTILAVAGTYADKELFDKLIKTAETATDRNTRQQAMIAAGRVEKPELVERSIEYFLHGKAPLDERVRILYGATKGPQSKKDQVVELLEAHFDAMVQIMPSFLGDPALPLIRMAAESACSRPSHDQLKTLFTSRTRGGKVPPRAIAQALESVELCTARRDTLIPQLQAYLKAQ